MIRQQSLVQKRFAEEDPESNPPSRGQAQQSSQAEKLERLGGIVQQKLYAQQVEQDAHGPRYSVVRRPVFSLDVRNWHFRHRRARPTGQRRNEAVQFTVQMNLR